MTSLDGLALDVTGSVEFSWDRSCPIDGTVATTGSMEWARDMETRTGTFDLTATRTYTDCARPLKDNTVIALNGEVTLTAHGEWQAGQWHGVRQITLVGVIDWATDDARSGSCEIDIEGSYDPENRTRTVTGTFCEHEVGGLRGWSWTPGHGPGHHGG